jgi:hypothetical protein
MSEDRLLDVVAALDVPDPFDINELVRRVAHRRGRPITLRAMRIGASGPSGLWIALRDADVICHEAGTNPVHQTHIVLHELGHMLCGHHSAAAEPDSVLRFLLPTLDPAAVARVLRRGSYHDEEEREAERFATLVRERAGQLPLLPQNVLPPRDADVLRRIESAL